MRIKALIIGVVSLGTLVASSFTPVIPSEVPVKSYIQTPGTYNLTVSQDGRNCELEERQGVSIKETRFVTPYSILNRKFRGGYTDGMKADISPQEDDFGSRLESMGWHSNKRAQLVFPDGTTSEVSSWNSSSFSRAIMIAPNLALTADHVVALANNYLNKEKIKPDFEYSDVSEMVMLAEESGYSIGGQKATLVHRDPDRDLALLLLESPIPTVKGSARFRLDPPTKNENIEIRVSNKEIIPVVSITYEPDRIVYSTNEIMEPGMSGSVIIDGKGRVVGVLQTAHPGTSYLDPEVRERVKEEVLTKYPEL